MLEVVYGMQYSYIFVHTLRRSNLSVLFSLSPSLSLHFMPICCTSSNFSSAAFARKEVITLNKYAKAYICVQEAFVKRILNCWHCGMNLQVIVNIYHLPLSYCVYGNKTFVAVKCCDSGIKQFSTHCNIRRPFPKLKHLHTHLFDNNVGWLGHVNANHLNSSYNGAVELLYKMICTPNLLNY